MANVKTIKGTIGILTGGGDVPGLNPAIRAITVARPARGVPRARHPARLGRPGRSESGRQKGQPDQIIELSEELVNKVGRTGGTFLHTSRTNPSHVRKPAVPPHLRDAYAADMNDLTPDVLKNLEHLGLDILIPIGGDDTLSYGVRLHKEGVKVIAIPKTMDNDVPGTDYCIGFSTCVTRTIEMTHALRTSAGSHERFLVIEVFGRYGRLHRPAAGDGGSRQSLSDPGEPVRARAAVRAALGRPRSRPVQVQRRAGLRGGDDRRHEGHGVRR